MVENPLFLFSCGLIWFQAGNLQTVVLGYVFAI